MPVWVNVPNCLTLARVGLALVFLVLLLSHSFLAQAAALGVFLVASLTDFVDGLLARKTGTVTLLGSILDPLADKALTISAFVGFVQIGLIAAWPVVLIVLRDLAVTALRFWMPPGSRQVQARSSGKNKTLIQYFWIVGTLSYLLLRRLDGWPAAWDEAAYVLIQGTLVVVVVMTLTSGVRYFLVNRDFLAGGRAA